MIRFRVNRRAGVAAYLQLVQQVKYAIRVGRLRPGEKLPTAKEVVADTAMNPNTVFKAYRALETEGLVEGKPGLGTFVSETLEQAETIETEQLRQELTESVARAYDAGLNREDIESVMTAVLNETTPKE